MSDNLATSLFPFDSIGLCLVPGRRLGSQLYAALRERILNGQIDQHVKLPTTRELARVLQISRTTAIHAYDQLNAEGLINARVGDGTYVSSAAVHMAQAQPIQTAAAAPLLSSLANRMAAYSNAGAQTGPPRAFRLGVPALDLFPGDVWARLYADFWRRAPQNKIGYSDGFGNFELRSMVAGYLRNSRGLACNPSQIILTAGSQQAIFLCAQLLLNPGEAAAMENPGYPRAASALLLAGAKLTGISVDAQGLVTQELAAHKKTRMVYVTPSNQYPMGVTLSLPRRLELLAWAEANDSYVLEDDYDGEYRYNGTPITLLASLDRNRRVLYMGTFSKIAFPGLRLGYIVAPLSLAAPLADLRSQYDRHSAVVEQAVMAEFIARGHFQRHVRRMRRASRARRDVMIDLWNRLKPGGLFLPNIAAGLHCTVPVASREAEDTLTSDAAGVGVEINPLKRFWLPDSLPGDQHYGLVMGFGGINEAGIASAVNALQKVWGPFST
jgi:GntR family transcriptional regulator/MocR family aminotransferase